MRRQTKNDALLDRLDQMLDEAQNGTFHESDYDETKLSRLESKWKQFISASLLAEENRAREQENLHSLISDISHQTKTPMTNIKMYAELLRERVTLQAADLSDGRTVKAGDALLRTGASSTAGVSETAINGQGDFACIVDELCRQTDKLDFLIGALTKMSRLETNTVAISAKRQSVYPMLEDICAEYRIKAEQKKIELRLLRSDDEPATDTFAGETTKQNDAEPQAVFDRKWTTEAIANIVDNAIKYSPANTTVTLSATVYELYTKIEVKDVGLGIAEEEQAKIFGRFYRSAKNAAVQEKEGVGIGLYLAREIVAKQNGYIRVRSNVGEGSTFQIFLPCS